MTNEELDSMSLEDTFEAVEDVLAHLQNDNAPLEESFRYYEAGLALLKHCNESIDRIEKKIIVLSKEDSDNDI